VTVPPEAAVPPTDRVAAPRDRAGTANDGRPMALRPEAAIEVAGLRHAFGTVAALRSVDLTVPPGGFTTLIGPSGCGKSTVLRVLAGLLTPSGGTARVAGRSCVGRPGLVAFMPQRDTLLPWRRALANATLGAEVAGDAETRRTAHRRAGELFERFGLGGFERAWPSQLSGGMRQRVALLRTFLAGRDVLALDEPFGALDALTRRELQVWLAEVLASDRRTCLLVTHDVDEALWLSDEVLVLSARPARVVARVGVPFARPRDPLLVADARFGALKAEVLGALLGRRG
jgi:ABC-type nitrate/sulfonate/bicarbonate transport system ATPase subunit